MPLQNYFVKYNNYNTLNIIKKQLTVCIGKGGIGIINLFSDKLSLEFSVERALKHSENGCVYLVRNRESGQRYIYREYKGTDEVYTRLQDVNSSYLPKIFAVEKHGGKTCVVEEYVQGDTLAFILEGGSIPVSSAYDIAVQICSALEVLHIQGAVHRDIKPENIIIDGDRVVLIDFDASRINKEYSSNDTMVMGTTGYAAPEQYGFAQTDSRADIYAFGVMLNEMLTNRHPSQKIADCYLKPVIEKCIEVNVNNRYKDAGELKAALENISGRKSNKITKKKHYLSVTAVLLCALAAVGFVSSSYTDKLKLADLQLSQSKEKIASLQEELFSKEMDIALAEKESVELIEDIQIPKQLWQGEIDAYSTPFYYDLDNDGYGEECYFGVWFGRMYMGELTYVERNGVTEEWDCPVEVMPAVWKIAADGTPAILYNPTYNIFDAKAEIWRVNEWGDVTAPVVYPLDDVWNSGIKTTFTTEHLGTYILRVTGSVNGQKMSGQAIMEIVMDGE